MKSLIRRWLGVDAIIINLNRTQAEMAEISALLNRLGDDIAVQSRALGRIINKIDPMFIVPEDDPARKAASDKLGDQVIRKILGEVKASNPTPRSYYD